MAGLTRAKGPLRVGAAAAQVVVPFPVTVGGYGPPRSTALDGEPVFARATVIEVGSQRFGLVSLEVLLVTQPLVAAVRQGASFPIWVTATHTHSSAGQFDRRLASQLGALGTFDARVEAALIDAARQALSQAERELTPAVMTVSAFDVSSLVRARTGDSADPRRTQVRFERADGTTIARWELLAAHPTLTARRTTHLDTDWPGALSAGADAGVTTVLSTSIGNASTQGAASDTAWAATIAGLTAITSARVEPALALSTVRVPLPHPDGSRLVPRPLQPLVENVLCAATEMDIEVSMLRLGPVTLLAVPLEPTFGATQLMAKVADGALPVALTGGYVGYLEPAAVVTSGTGEAKRQWFGPSLFERVAAAAELVTASTR